MTDTKCTGLVLTAAKQLGGPEPSIVTLADRSRYSLSGVMTNVTHVQLPSGLWVMEFNGASSRIRFGNPVDHHLDFGDGSFSIAHWARVPVDLGDVGNLGMVDKREAAGNLPGYGTFIRGAGHGALPGEINGVVRDVNNLQRVVSNNSPTTNYADGIWHQIVFLANMSSVTGLQLFIDSVEATYNDQEDPTGLASIDSDQQFSLGIFQGMLNFFHGQLGCACLFNYILSPGQILEHYEAERRLFDV